MNTLPAFAEALALFLLTYLIHSSMLLIPVAVALRCRTRKRETRVLLLRSALTVPVISSLAVTLFDVPHLGWSLTVAAGAQRPSASEAAAGHSTVMVDSTADVSRPPAQSGLNAQSAETPVSAPGRGTVESTDGTVMEDGSRGLHRLFATAGWVWLAGLLLLLVRLAVLMRRLRELRLRSPLNGDERIHAALNRLTATAKLRGTVELRESEEISGPVAGGWWQPYILVPGEFLGTLSPPERDGLLAHELAHIVRRDVVWKLVSRLVAQAFWFQPGNHVLRRQLDIEAEFLADEQASAWLQESLGLVRCLTRLGEWMLSARSRRQPLTVGMASFRTTLGRRVESLLQHHPGGRSLSRPVRALLLITVIAFLPTAMLVAPRAVADTPEPVPSEKAPSMKTPLATVALLAGLTLPMQAEDEKPAERPPVTKTTADELPDGIARFNGMIVGRLVKKDIEQGTFIVQVDAIPRVWRNSQAKNPKSIVGKNVEVGGVFGKWLDALLVIREGETLEVETRHDGGSRLTFPGEMLRKVAPYKAEDYPELPETARGFRGAVAGKVVKKDTTFEIILQVERVLETWKENGARNANDLEGKQVMVIGFWNRQDFFNSLKEGDRIEVGLQHAPLTAEQLSVAEFARKADGEPRPRPEANRVKEAEETAEGGFPAGMVGFRGMLIGKLVSKDVEKGEFVARIQQVKRTWPKNTAKNPQAVLEREIAVHGVFGKWLDVLVTTKPGEVLEFEAFHSGGSHLTFPGEWLKKVE